MLKRQKDILRRLFDINSRAQNYVILPAVASNDVEESSSASLYEVLSQDEVKQAHVRAARLGICLFVSGAYQSIPPLVSQYAINRLTVQRRPF